MYVYVYVYVYVFVFVCVFVYIYLSLRMLRLASLQSNFAWFKKKNPLNPGLGCSFLQAVFQPCEKKNVFVTYSAKGRQNESLNSIFPTKYVISKSLKVSHWLSQCNNSQIVKWKNLEDLQRCFWASISFPENFQVACSGSNSFVSIPSLSEKLVLRSSCPDHLKAGGFCVNSFQPLKLKLSQDQISNVKSDISTITTNKNHKFQSPNETQLIGFQKKHHQVPRSQFDSNFPGSRPPSSSKQLAPMTGRLLPQFDV